MFQRILKACSSGFVLNCSVRNNLKLANSQTILLLSIFQRIAAVMHIKITINGPATSSRITLVPKFEKINQ